MKGEDDKRCDDAYLERERERPTMVSESLKKNWKRQMDRKGNGRERKEGECEKRINLVCKT